jgi:hypothetical protein
VNQALYLDRVPCFLSEVGAGTIYVNIDRICSIFAEAMPDNDLSCIGAPAITFIPCEEHFRPVLPTVEGNVDYLALRGQLTTMDELLRSSGLENDFVARSLKHWIKTLTQSKIDQIELSREGQCGMIELEDPVHGRKQERFQGHSIRALRCAIARTLSL